MRPGPSDRPASWSSSLAAIHAPCMVAASRRATDRHRGPETPSRQTWRIALWQMPTVKAGIRPTGTNRMLQSESMWHTASCCREDLFYLRQRMNRSPDKLRSMSIPRVRALGQAPSWLRMLGQPQTGKMTSQRGREALRPADGADIFAWLSKRFTNCLKRCTNYRGTHPGGGYQSTTTGCAAGRCRPYYSSQQEE
jgi:hypothetical protein